MQIARAVRQRGITHLHAHFASVSPAVARLAAPLAVISYSVTAHATDIFHEDVDHEQLRRILADAFDVVTVSDFNLDHLRVTFGTDADRVRRVYNGIDLDELGSSDPETARRRSPRSGGWWRRFCCVPLRCTALTAAAGP